MRKWMPAAGLSAVAATGLLLINSAGAQQMSPATPPPVTAPPPAAMADTTFLAGGVDVEYAKGMEAVKPVTVSFPGRQVLSAEVMLKGFDIAFVDAEHPVHQTKIKLENVQISGETVKFDARMVIRDNSGDIDDKYTGHVDYVVIARVK